MSNVPRMTPQFSINAAGQVNWISALLEHDPKLFPRGKTVTSEEFNNLFIKQCAQGNYTSDSFNEFINTHLNTAIFRQVKDRFKIFNGYMKLFLTSDWSEADEEGYHYIDIPATEHGFLNTSEEETFPSVEAVMYAVNSDETLYELDQFEISVDNTVRIYTDDPSLYGVVAIRPNDKGVSVNPSLIIDASQIVGLPTVAFTGDYTDLINKPDKLITKNAQDITAILEGTQIVKNATNAEIAEIAKAIGATGKIGGVLVSTIFEEGTGTVKNATNATNAINATNATNATNAVNATNATFALYANADMSLGTINERLTKLGFKQGSLNIEAYENMFDVNTTQNELKRQGNYVIGRLQVYYSYIAMAQNAIIIRGTVPDEYIPKSNEHFVGVIYYQGGTSIISGATFNLQTDGTFIILLGRESGTFIPTDVTLYCAFGYEATPL